MNCKPGNIARIVAPYAPSGRNRFVEVLRPAAQVEVLNGMVFEKAFEDEAAWVCSGSVPAEGGVFTLLSIGDRCLRPLHDGDGVDESLTWREVPKPVGVSIPSRSVEFAR